MAEKRRVEFDDGRGVQRELFPELAGPAKRRRPLRKNVVDSGKMFLKVPYENCVFVIIGVIMAIIISFSLGVERGKRLRPKAAAALLPAAKEEIPLTESAPAEAYKEPFSDAIKKEPAVKGAEAPVKDEAEAASAEKPAPKGDVYTIQVASFRKKASAVDEVARLAKNGYAGFMAEDKRWFRVYAGRCDDADAARVLLKDLKPLYKDAYIRKLTGQ